MFSKLAILYKSLMIQLCFFLATNNLISKPFIIFHFEGNIADTIGFEGGVILNFLNELGYKKSNGNQFDIPSDIEVFRNQSSSDAIISLKINLIHMIDCFNKVVGEMATNIKSIKPIRGMRETLHALSNEGFELGIVTNNSKENVINFLKNNDLDGLFGEKIITGDASTMLKMHDLLDQFVTNFNLNPKEVLFVGDRVSHAQAILDCKYINLCLIVLGWESYSSSFCFDNWIKSTPIPDNKSIISYKNNENLAKIIKNLFC